MRRFVTLVTVLFVAVVALPWVADELDPALAASGAVQDIPTSQPSSTPIGKIKITLLGTGAGPPIDLDRYGPSTLVEAGSEKLLFDCGREVTLRLAQAGVPLGQIRNIVLTHLHSDHVVGLPDLYLTPWASDAARQEPIEVWGPVGTRTLMRHLRNAFAFDIHVRRDIDEKYSPRGITFAAHDISQGVIFNRNGVRVTAFLVDHAVVKPAFGYRVDYSNRSVALSGDTRKSDNLIAATKGVDVLIHEPIDADAERANPGNRTARQMENIIGHHTSLQEAGEVFSRVKPRLGVYSHITGDGAELVARTRSTYSEHLESGEDLMTIDVGDEIQVHRFMKHTP